MNRFFLILVLLLSLPACAIDDSREVFSLVPLQIGGHRIEVQLADTPQKRAQGLMFQHSAEPGMLLLYSEPREIALWMVNTAMPLDVAYIDADWAIAELITLEPFDETPVPSQQPVIAALEMPRGWFAAKGITIGTRILLNIEPKP